MKLDIRNSSSKPERHSSNHFFLQNDLLSAKFGHPYFYYAKLTPTINVGRFYFQQLPFLPNGTKLTCFAAFSIQIVQDKLTKLFNGGELEIKFILHFSTAFGIP